MAGQLFVVATPLGNLEDLTFRALRILREADLVACEYTRQTMKLLRRYDLRKELVSYFEPNEGRRIPLLIDRLKKGQKVALVSDAGTPAISDPGYRLVREAIKEGVAVVPIPGPSAATAALSASGLPTHRFLFLGFAPAKAHALRKALLDVAGEKGTLLFFVPARKLAFFLETAGSTLGDRPAVIAREVTKIFEEFIRGTISQVQAEIGQKKLKGEVTVLLGGAEK